MNRYFKLTTIIWLIILTITSTITLCRTFYRDVNVEVDYLGIIVGLLAILCTVLIGWQIYSVIDFSQREKDNASKIKELDRLMAESRKDLLYRSYISRYAIADIYAYLCNAVVTPRADYECIKNRLESLYYASVLEEWDLCKLIATMTQKFVEQRKPKFNSAEKDEFINIVSSVNGHYFQNEFCNLISVIQGINS